MHRIAVIPGDGTGPEVVREGLKVLRAVSDIEGFQVETVHFDLFTWAPSATLTSNPESLKKACCCGSGSSLSNTSTCAP